MSVSSDPGSDLAEQLVLERDRGCELSLGVGVLGLEVGDDRLVLLVSEPLPVVCPGVAVRDVDGRLAGRDSEGGERRRGA